jgi:hypothetical protein
MARNMIKLVGSKECVGWRRLAAGGEREVEVVRSSLMVKIYHMKKIYC